MLSVAYAQCHYAECHYAECRYAECRYAGCRYAECLGANKSTADAGSSNNTRLALLMRIA